MRHYLSIDQNTLFSPQNTNKITASEMSNISIEANIVDPDQTAPTGAVWSGSTLFVCEASNILLDDKNIRFVIMRCKG